MSIRVVCPQCGTSGKAPEALIGKKVRCKVCSGPISVPDPRTWLEPGSTPGTGARPVESKTADAKASDSKVRPKPVVHKPVETKPVNPGLGRAVVWGPIAWLFVGWAWALMAPWLGLTAEALTIPLHYLPLA